MAACAVIPIRQNLYAVEEDLTALLECVETVEPEQEHEFLTALGVALTAAKDKRDQVAHWMSHLESQIELSKSETCRLKERRAGFELQLERLKGYVVRIMEMNDRKKLEGDSVTFARRRCPAAVEIADQNQVPLEYQAVSLTVPAKLLDNILDSVPEGLAQVLLAIVRPEDYAIDKRSVKAALEANADVPGARFAPEKWSLVRL